jgi:predicted acylesterase/phospholipase RssA
VDISYKTHPEWRVIDAAYASSCLPIIFTPFSKDGNYYIDGGLFLNYPIEPCIKCCRPEEILGIRKVPTDPEKYEPCTNKKITENTGLIDYIMILMTKIMKKTSQDKDNHDCKNEIILYAEQTSLSELIQTASSIEKRTEWIKKGEDFAKKWILEQTTFNQQI